MEESGEDQEHDGHEVLRESGAAVTVEVGSLKVAVLGGTGAMGSKIARQLSAKNEVCIGSRIPERAVATASGIPGAKGTGETEAAEWCEAAILSIPFRAIGSVSKLAVPLAGKLVLSMVNPLRLEGGVFRYASAGRSAAETIAGALPDSAVATAFNNIPDAYFARSERGEADVFVAADTRATYEKAAGLIRSIRSLRPLYVGPLSEAETVERMTAMILNAARLNGIDRPYVRFIT